jgi:hypothetical protein
MPETIAVYSHLQELLYRAWCEETEIVPSTI